MIKGIVPDFGYDVKLAITIDGEKSDDIPKRGLYKTNVSCTNYATGEWDYNAWNLKLDNVSEGTKCNLEFTSNLTEEEYNNYLEAGVSLRRNTYRGKDITNYKSLPEENELNLYKQIKSCQFNDIYVGDYIKTNTNGKEVTWLIADLNNYLHTGFTDLKECHATIIPAEPLEDSKMNETNTTGVVDTVLNKGAYVGSKMKQEVLPRILTAYIKPAFNEHIMTYTNMLADQMDENHSNQYGSNDGASSNWAWYASELDLMSEVNVYGTIVVSSSLFDIGIDNRQYAIFGLKPEFINSYNNTRFRYWLKAVAISEGFAIVSEGGTAAANYSSGSLGVRPRFLID